MATGTATKKTAKKAPAKKTAAPAPEVTADEEVAFGVSDIAQHLTKKHKLAKPVTTRELRTLIRKMARDGRVDREIIPGNRTRYAWSGIDDAEVQAIIAAYDAGELEDDKKAKLAALKERKAAKKAEAAPAEDETGEDEEDEELELEDEE